MTFKYHIQRITDIAVQCGRFGGPYRYCRSNISSVVSSKEGWKTRLGVCNEHVPNRKHETVLRIKNGEVEVIEPAKDDTFATDIQMEPQTTLPQIDINSFKNHIEIPPQGIGSLFSQRNLPVLINDIVAFKQYINGSQHAHHYPLNLLPRKLSAKLSSDIMVSTFTVHQKDYKVRDGRIIRLSAIPTLKTQHYEVLLQKLYGKNTILIVFSGNIPYSDATSALEWKHAITFDSDVHIVLNAPCPIGMSYFHKRYLNSMANTLVERNTFYCINCKLKPDETIALHQYRTQFASLLLVDKLGYIRWHAVGRPTTEAKCLLKEAYEKLLSEI